MRLLLDTNVTISILANDERISSDARTRLSQPESDCLCSIVSLWEIAIKLALNKLKLEVPLSELPSVLNDQSNIRILHLATGHVFGLASLPHHHRDPFDRMLIAQAKFERMTIVTRDRIFERYDVGVMLA